MKITISNEIIIEEPSEAMIFYCKKNLEIANPEYAKKERMGFYVGNTPKKLCLYKKKGNKLIIPIGAFKGILPFASNDVEITKDLADNGRIDYQAKDFSLYDYQQEAVDHMIKSGYGILESKAGSGKTQMGIALICALGVKALWLTHTQDLLTQSYNRALQYIDEKMLGKITGGKINIGSGITFATVQTLSKQDMSQYKYEWDCVIVDECHRCAGTPTSVSMFSKVINSLAAGNKFGLSATVHRADGLIKSTFALLGGVAYKVPDSAIANKVMQVTVRKCNTFIEPNEFDYTDTDGTIIYSKLINCLCENENRNKFIANNLISNENGYNLILSDRIAHLEALYEMLPPYLKAQAKVITGRMTSKKGRAEREQAIEDMRTGEKHYLFATYSLAKEGLDIPRLDRLHLTTPQKDKAVIVQSAGRIARKFEGKTEPICYDYVDEIGIAQGYFKKRCTHYRSCGYNIC